MTARADIASRRADIASRRADAASARAASGAAACPASGTFRLVARLLSALQQARRARPPGAGGLTDRQLADIGLKRADLPDHRGWRR